MMPKVLLAIVGAMVGGAVGVVAAFAVGFAIHDAVTVPHWIAAAVIVGAGLAGSAAAFAAARKTS